MNEHASIATTPVPAADEIGAAARELITELILEPSGQSSPSIYETGRLVSIAPWLVRHADRVTYLLDQQRPDGSWGIPADGYALVPTLSAVEALLSVLLDDAANWSPPPSARLATAALRGLRVLADWLTPPSRPSIPDLPAVDLTVPALIAAINTHLDRLPDTPARALFPWPDGHRLNLPAGMSDSRLRRVRQAVAAGAQIPEKLLHALEVVPDLVAQMPGLTPTAPGTIGASPAATAAWLGAPSVGRGDTAARSFLTNVVHRYGGPVPCALPITVFERAWVLTGLARSGMDLTVPAQLVEGLTDALGPLGTPAGPGLPADADTTSVAVTALLQLGVAADPACLWAYQTPSHFCTWLGEDGVSVSTNAHVLDALGQWLLWATSGASRRSAWLPAPTTATPARSRGELDRCRRSMRQLSDWLRDQQCADGSWQDRWHASPYYATACAALALADHGTGPGSADAVTRAVDWVLATQRVDGSWGRWSGTVEETAYALQILLASTRSVDLRVGTAATRGYTYLMAAVGQQEDPALWHDKDLYLPPAIVRAATLSARRMVEQRPDLVPPGKLSEQ